MNYDLKEIKTIGLRYVNLGIRKEWVEFCDKYKDENKSSLRVLAQIGEIRK